MVTTSPFRVYFVAFYFWHFIWWHIFMNSSEWVKLELKYLPLIRCIDNWWFCVLWCVINMMICAKSLFLEERKHIQLDPVLSSLSNKNQMASLSYHLYNHVTALPQIWISSCPQPWPRWLRASFPHEHPWEHTHMHTHEQISVQWPFFYYMPTNRCIMTAPFNTSAFCQSGQEGSLFFSWGTF